MGSIPNKQTTKATLFTKDFYSENDYPKSRVTINIVNNKWSFENSKTWLITDYDSDKVKVINSKLWIRDWLPYIKQVAKISKDWNPYSMPDQTNVNLEIDEFIELLSQKEDILDSIDKFIEEREKETVEAK